MDSVRPVLPPPVRATVGALLLFVVAVVSPVVAPQPALGAEAEAKLHLDVPDSTMFRESAGNGLYVRISNYGDAEATNLVLTIDASGLAAGITLIRAEGPCTFRGDQVRCEWAELAPNRMVEMLFDSTVAVGTAPGPSGSIVFSAASTEASAPGRSMPVEVAVPLYADMYPASNSPQGVVGDIVTVRVNVTNRGPHDSGYWAVTVGTDIDGLVFIGGPCDGPEVLSYKCSGPVLAPGESHTIHLQFRITAPSNYYCGLGFIYSHPDPDRSDGLCPGDHGIVTYAGAVTGGGGTGGSGSAYDPAADNPPLTPEASAPSRSVTAPVGSPTRSTTLAGGTGRAMADEPSHRGNRGLLLPVGATTVVLILVAVAALVWRHTRRATNADPSTGDSGTLGTP
jgi:hypothetical protein